MFPSGIKKESVRSTVFISNKIYKSVIKKSAMKMHEEDTPLLKESTILFVNLMKHYVCEQ